MYNAEQKTRFVKSYTEAAAVREEALKLFNALEPCEERLGRDLCAMEGEELRLAVGSQMGTKNRSRHTRLTILREYGRWCTENGIPGATDALQNLQDIGIERMRQTTLRNPRHLQSWLDIICAPESANTSDNTVRAFCWLCYAGLSQDDAITVRSSEVDFRTQTIRRGGREYPIYPESLPAMHNCVELERFKRPRVPGDLLLRGIKGKPTVLSFRTDVGRKRPRLIGTPMEDMDISFNRIWLSGLFYRMYEEEQAGFPVDFLKAADAQLYDLPARASRSGPVPNKKRNELAREYKIDYERWKQTLII